MQTTLRPPNARPFAPAFTTRMPALVVKLDERVELDDDPLPRAAFGYWAGMSEKELQDSARAWWYISLKRVESIRYLVAAHDGIVVGVWEIERGSWTDWPTRPVGVGKVRRRAACRVRAADPSIVGQFLGKAVPKERPDGSPFFGTQSSFAYWPN